MRSAWGCGREEAPEFLEDLRKARASAFELDYQRLLAHDLGYLPEEIQADLAQEVVEVRKMVSGLARRISSSA